MGATGALAMALARRRLSLPLLRQAMDATAKLTSFVVFILVGSRVFSLTFYGVDGNLWVEHLLLNLPGGQLGFLIVVNLLVFVLAFFLDFFELAFIVIPLLGPVAEKLGIDLIWFGVLLAVNMQTSFMHPPFGFALFYLRSVAPAKDYLDRVSGKLTAKVTTMQIYWGAVPFVLIQVIMVALIIAVPGIVSGGLAKKAAVDVDKIEIQVPEAAAGAGGKSEDDMENALESELGDDSTTGRRQTQRRSQGRRRQAGRGQRCGRGETARRQEELGTQRAESECLCACQSHGRQKKPRSRGVFFGRERTATGLHA